MLRCQPPVCGLLEPADFFASTVLARSAARAGKGQRRSSTLEDNPETALRDQSGGAVRPAEASDHFDGTIRSPLLPVRSPNRRW